MNALKEYEILSVIGEGTFGVVKLGKLKETGEKVAIKILEKKKILNKEDEERVTREIDILKRVKHINVIKIIKIKEDKENIYLIMEFCEKGELFNHIVEEQKLEEIEAAYYYYQLINGLECIHHNGIVHRDLKPENLLLTEGYILKIIDFGLSNYFDKEKLLVTPCGSPCYASPEMVSGQKYNGFMIDVWSTGIILYAMLCGYLPFEDQDNEILFKKILSCNAEFPEDLSNDAIDLMKKIMVTDPQKRITIPEIKKHPFYLKGKKKFESAYPDLVSEIIKDYDDKEKIEEEKRKNILSEANINENTLEIQKYNQLNQESNENENNDFHKNLDLEIEENLKNIYDINNKKLENNVKIESLHSEKINNDLVDYVNEENLNINKNNDLDNNLKNILDNRTEFNNKKIIDSHENEKTKTPTINNIKRKHVKTKRKKDDNSKKILENEKMKKIVEEEKTNEDVNMNKIFACGVVSESEIQHLNLLSIKEDKKLKNILENNNKINSQRNENKNLLIEDNLYIKNLNHINNNIITNSNKINNRKYNIPNLKNKGSVTGNKINIKSKKSFNKNIRKVESLSNKNNKMKMEKQFGLKQILKNNKNNSNINGYEIALTEINDKKENNAINLKSSKNNHFIKLGNINGQKTEIKERKRKENILINTINNNKNKIPNQRPLYKNKKNNDIFLSFNTLNANNNLYDNTISTISNSIDQTNNKVKSFDSFNNDLFRNNNLMNYSQNFNKVKKFQRKIRINNHNNNLSQKGKKINVFDQKTFNHHLKLNNLYNNNNNNFNYQNLNNLTENHSLYSDIIYKRKFDSKYQNSTLKNDNNLTSNNLSNYKTKEMVTDDINKIKSKQIIKIKDMNNNLNHKKNISNYLFPNKEYNKIQMNNYKHTTNKAEIKFPLNETKNKDILDINRGGYNNRKNHNYYISSGKGIKYLNFPKKTISDLNTIKKNEHLDLLNSNQSTNRYINTQINNFIPKYNQRLLGLLSNSADKNEKYKINNYINNFTINNVETPINLYSSHNLINTIENDNNIQRRIKSNNLNYNNSFDENLYQNRYINNNNINTFQYKINNRLLKNAVNDSYRRPKENNPILIEESENIYDTITTRPNNKYLSNYNLNVNFLNSNNYNQFNQIQTDIGDLYDEKLNLRKGNNNYRITNNNNKISENKIISKNNNSIFERRELFGKNHNNFIKGNINNIKNYNAINNNYNKINNNKKNYAQIPINNNKNKENRTIIKGNIEDLLSNFGKESNYKRIKNYQNIIHNNKISFNNSNFINSRKNEKTNSFLSQDIIQGASEYNQYLRPKNVSYTLSK